MAARGCEEYSRPSEGVGGGGVGGDEDYGSALLGVAIVSEAIFKLRNTSQLQAAHASP
jgi:hypothetical protein